MRCVRPEPHKGAMNQLKVNLQHAIIVLAEGGTSGRDIARQLGIDRGTVAKYLAAAAPAISTPGSAGDPVSKPAISTAGSAVLPDSKPAISTLGSRAGRQSLCGPWQEAITTWLELGRTAQWVYQELVSAHGFTGSYQSVKRFARQWRTTQPVPFVRMEVEPGAEAQVDFGQGAWVIGHPGRRRPHLFRIVLSHSRKAYSEVVWRQTTEEFIRCLENAFRHFGGVPRTLVVDNLRAAVTRADWYEPDLNPKVAEFCRHYGTVMLPTRPAMPRHKGKVEAGVKYAQNNALAGRKFTSLAEQNLYLSQWERTVADTRLHGTTRQQVGRVFAEVERAALRPLPPSLFPNFSEAPRTVHRDGHVELLKAYYSVPPEYVGRKVIVRWEARLVRIHNQRLEVIATHVRAEPGKFTTDPQHLQGRHRRFIERGVDYLLDRARLLGRHTGSWAEAMYQQRGIAGMRVLHGLLHLAEKHPVAALERAAAKALHHGAWRLRDLRSLLAQPHQLVQTDFLETHPLIRSLAAYAQADCFAASPKNREPIPA